MVGRLRGLGRWALQPTSPISPAIIRTKERCFPEGFLYNCPRTVTSVGVPATGSSSLDRCPNPMTTTEGRAEQLEAVMPTSETRDPLSGSRVDGNH